jgi:hypothetical protein
MLKTILPSFTDEMRKIAFVANKPTEKADAHFIEEVKDWGVFEKNLKAKGFQKAVLGHPEADAKLKRYVKNFGGYLNSKDILGKVSSRTGFKSYTIKKLPNGRLGCNCKDWQYAHSTRNSDCWHVAEFKTHGKEKTSASPVSLLARGLGTARRLDKGEKEKLKGRVASENVRRIHAGQLPISIRL